MAGIKTRNLKLEEIMLICILSQKFTQVDIARMLKCSPGTVKLAVNGKTKVAKKAWFILKNLELLLLQYGVKQLK